MLFNLLAESNSGSTNANPSGGADLWIWVILLGFMALLIVYNYFSSKKRREQAEQEKEKRNAIRPGFTVTTIGGILGTVVEVDDEANTFVLETGKADSPSYIKFDKVAIYSSEDPNAVNNEVVKPTEGEKFENETISTENEESSNEEKAE